jgi:hypothetical protein
MHTYKVNCKRKLMIPKSKLKSIQSRQQCILEKPDIPREVLYHHAKFDPNRGNGVGPNCVMMVEYFPVDVSGTSQPQF